MNMREAAKDKSLVYGVGINDADYMVTRYKNINKKKQTIWRCPVYKAWVNMLRRCYSSSLKKMYPTYKDASVCKEWHTFSNFREWMIAQDFQGKALDKDILFSGNKLYSPETCVFVSAKTNAIFSLIWRESKTFGCTFKKKTGMYEVIGCGYKKQITKLGSFDSYESAQLAWKKFRNDQVMNLAREQTDKRVAEAIISRLLFVLPPAPEGGE